MKPVHNFSYYNFIHNKDKQYTSYDEFDML